MWHLVCGDNAVAGVTHVIGLEAAEAGLRVLRDDLAVGPLGDVDAQPCAARAAFWRGVWPAGVTPVPDFEADLPADAQWLAEKAYNDGRTDGDWRQAWREAGERLQKGKVAP